MALSARLKGIQRVHSLYYVRPANRWPRRVMSSAGKACFAITCFVFGTAMLPGIRFAQETASAPTEEIVVNLASGRVVIAVVKDAILIGTVETPIEPQTYVPNARSELRQRTRRDHFGRGGLVFAVGAKNYCASRSSNYPICTAILPFSRLLPI